LRHGGRKRHTNTPLSDPKKRAGRFKKKEKGGGFVLAFARGRSHGGEDMSRVGGENFPSFRSRKSPHGGEKGNLLSR